MGKVRIRVYQNKNSKSRAYRKFYGRVSHASTIDVSTLCAHAAMDSGIERSLVPTVYDAQLKQMKELLCNGHAIKVDGLGTFKLGVESEGVSEEEVQQRHPQFDPETEDIRKYLSARQVKRARLLFTPCAEIKSALRSVKYETDKSDWNIDND